MVNQQALNEVWCWECRNCTSRTLTNEKVFLPQVILRSEKKKTMIPQYLKKYSYHK